MQFMWQRRGVCAGDGQGAPSRLLSGRNGLQRGGQDLADGLRRLLCDLQPDCLTRRAEWELHNAALDSLDARFAASELMLFGAFHKAENETEKVTEHDG